MASAKNRASTQSCPEFWKCVRTTHEPLGVTPVTHLAGATFADFQRSEIAKWGKAVRDAGVKAD